MMKKEFEAKPEWHQPLGIILALSSGIFIGTSLILQKKGLLDTEAARLSSGNEYEYLKSKLWWIGISFSKRERHIYYILCKTN
jgi:hypothetical protein